MASGRIKGFWRSGKPTCLSRGIPPTQIPAWILRSALLRRDRILRAPDRVIRAIMRLLASMCLLAPGGATGRSDPAGAGSGGCRSTVWPETDLEASAIEGGQHGS
jgi:hypothetical protein